MRSDHITLPVFLSNISASKTDPILYCLSRTSSVLYSLFIDISLFVIQGSIELVSSTTRAGEARKHMFCMIETGHTGHVILAGEAALDSYSHSNQIVVLDKKMNEITRKELICEGRGRMVIDEASWIEKAIPCKLNNKTFVALVIH